VSPKPLCHSKNAAKNRPAPLFTLFTTHFSLTVPAPLTRIPHSCKPFRRGVDDCARNGTVYRGGRGGDWGRALFAPGFVIVLAPHPHVLKCTLRCGPSTISRHASEIAPPPARREGGYCASIVKERCRFMGSLNPVATDRAISGVIRFSFFSRFLSK
jgi:hypothetical protein